YASGLRFLASASELLSSSSLDYEQTLRTLAELAVPDVADWCAVDRVEGPESLRRVAVQHTDPERVAVAVRLAERFPQNRGAGGGSWQVIEPGESAFYPEISADELAATLEPEQVDL